MKFENVAKILRGEKLKKQSAQKRFAYIVVVVVIILLIPTSQSVISRAFHRRCVDLTNNGKTGISAKGIKHDAAQESNECDC